MRFLLGQLALLALLSASGLAEIRVISGTGREGYAGDGKAAKEAQLNQPFGLIRDAQGRVIFCDTLNNAVRRIEPDGTISTIAGTGQPGYSGDGGLATKATLREPYEVRQDKDGQLFFVEMQNHLIRRVDSKTGLISTVAGNGQPGFSGDEGPATQASFRQPHSIQFSPDGRLFVCDIGNHRVRVINLATGIIRTFSGTGEKKLPEDGAKFSQAALFGPRAIDFDAKGDLWLALREGNRVYRFDMAKGTLHHVAGTGQQGFTGNGGPAKEATLSGPKGLSVGPDGRVFLADTESHSIRAIDPKTGLLQLVAGTGQTGDGPDGDPLSCALHRPHGIFVDASGVYIGDSSAHRVRHIRE